MSTNVATAATIEMVTIDQNVIVYLLHSLLLGFTCTCTFILALLGVEGVADGDVQTVATASCFL